MGARAVQQAHRDGSPAVGPNGFAMGNCLRSAQSAHRRVGSQANSAKGGRDQGLEFCIDLCKGALNDGRISSGENCGAVVGA